MGKISITDLSRILVENYKLSPREAEAFVSDLFETIKQGLEADSQVKIKGLGTFKIIDVEARASVSVNTGERVLIDSHGKITFTPDAAMKDNVNKPFSQFETVILNEGVDFDDMEVASDEPAGMEQDADRQPQASEMLSVDESEAVVEKPETVVEEPNVLVEEPESTTTEAETVVNEPETAVENIETTDNGVEDELAEETEMPTEEPETLADEEATHENNDSETPEDEEELSDDEDEPEPRGRFWRWLWTGVKVLLIILVAFCVGYIVGKMVVNMDNNDAQSDAISLDSLAKIQLEEPDSIAADTLNLAPKPSEADSIKAVSQENVDSMIVAKVEDVEEKPDYLKYNEMDIRLRKGYYYIMGTKEIHKVGRGDNLRRITKRYLGDTELMPYIRVYNGLSADDTLTIGQEIKIPVLYTKKYVDKKMKEKQALSSDKQ